MKNNDLYYMACDKFTLYLQTGNKNFKIEADKIMLDYINKGGKKELKYIN